VGMIVIVQSLCPEVQSLGLDGYQLCLEVQSWPCFDVSSAISFLLELFTSSLSHSALLLYQCLVISFFQDNCLAPSVYPVLLCL